LVLTDCDVLPRSVVDAILAFQQRGGIIVGDERLCPAIGADVTLPIYSRTKQADADKAALQTHAVMLREQLAGRYAATVSSSNPDVLVYRRHGGKADYVFAVNDNREYGTYVGNHGLVMENGLPAAATIALPGHSAHAYDLVKGYEVPLLKHDGGVSMDVQLEPGGGQVFLVTQSPIAAVQIHGPDRAKPGDTVGLNITVVGDEGVPVEAVIPVELDVRDPDGRPAEYCGHYGAKDGALRVELTLAPNDTPGVWTVRASESASGMTARHFFRVAP